jgi:hypothetical protein
VIVSQSRIQIAKKGNSKSFVPYLLVSGKRRLESRKKSYEIREGLYWKRLNRRERMLPPVDK